MILTEYESSHIDTDGGNSSSYNIYLLIDLLELLLEGEIKQAGCLLNEQVAKVLEVDLMGLIRSGIMCIIVL